MHGTVNGPSFAQTRPPDRSKAGNEFNVAATGTKLNNNASNTGNSGSTNENSGKESLFGVAITNQGVDPSDGTRASD